jgi:hypothetical protein
MRVGKFTSIESIDKSIDRSVGGGGGGGRSAV